MRVRFFWVLFVFLTACGGITGGGPSGGGALDGGGNYPGGGSSGGGLGGGQHAQPYQSGFLDPGGEPGKFVVAMNLENTKALCKGPAADLYQFQLVGTVAPPVDSVELLQGRILRSIDVGPAKFHDEPLTVQLLLLSPGRWFHVGAFDFVIPTKYPVNLTYYLLPLGNPGEPGYGLKSCSNQACVPEGSTLLEVPPFTVNMGDASQAFDFNSYAEGLPLCSAINPEASMPI